MDPIIPFESASQAIDKLVLRIEEGILTLFDHLLDGASWVDLHCE